MPPLGNNVTTLLHGLSDFWLRFYADYDELAAMYQGTEVLLGQAYLDMLSSFLNISIAETPLFNKEFFKLLTVREDTVTFSEGLNPEDDGYVFSLPDTIVDAQVLQNKVVDPTASLERHRHFSLDDAAYTLRFKEDPSGQPLDVLGYSAAGHLLTYGVGTLTRFYVENDGTAPYAKAQPGQWLQLFQSGSGNDKTVRVAEVLDAYTLLLQGTFTLPEVNNGALEGTLLDATFQARAGFARRSVTVGCGGLFDDALRRTGGSFEMASWYAAPPIGLGVRKGDILRIFAWSAPAPVPQDYVISVVRHEGLYLAATPAPPKTLATCTDYVILRESANSPIEQPCTFVQSNRDKTGTLGSTLWDSPAGAATFQLDPLTPGADQFTPGTDQGRYITLLSGGTLSWTASLDAAGYLSWTAGTVERPLSRAVPYSQIYISGSLYGQDGTYTLLENVSDAIGRLSGTVFMPETNLTVTLLGITNQGTYRIHKVLTALEAILEPAVACGDPLNGAISYEIHDGYQAVLDHTHGVEGSLTVYAGVGDQYTGGLRSVVEGTDFVIKSRTSTLIQTGRFMGQWGVTAPVRVAYAWLNEIVSTPTGTEGTLDGTVQEQRVTSVALWAPDIKVDKYHLYTNYGYLINRFQASSETYREFIRGVFQLYMLGPTLERVESALNVIGSLPVIRDDGEVLQEYDTTSSSEYVFIHTVRAGGTPATYQYPTGTPIREDIVNWSEGDAEITFKSFEPLTTMFQVTDYVQDPLWWDSIVIPEALLPRESKSRRTTTSLVYENVVAPTDDGRIGDPGFFIGADDEGIVPAFIEMYPAKRRKFAHEMMNTFLKWHFFYVHLDPLAFSRFDTAFINDLQDLVLIAKPGYTYCYIEPASSFHDEMVLQETALTLDAAAILESEEIGLGEQTLTLESFSWTIGYAWRYAVYVPSESLTVTSPPDYTQLSGTHLILYRISGPVSLEENVDFWVDAKEGRVYPLVTWPEGTYTIAYQALILTEVAVADPSVGDTPFTIGAPHPQLRGVRQEAWLGVITQDSKAAYLTCDIATFNAAMHTGQVFAVHESSSGELGVCTIRGVVSPTQVILDRYFASASVRWRFLSEEPYDGRIRLVGSATRFTTPSGMFRSKHSQGWLRIADSGAGNEGIHRISEVHSMFEVTLEGSSFSAETDVHWRFEGQSRGVDMLERPVQITAIPT